MRTFVHVYKEKKDVIVRLYARTQKIGHCISFKKKGENIWYHSTRS